MSQGKSAYYSNEVVLAPNNQVLFRGSSKKVDWYLDRDLAEIVEEGPPRTIRLLFEPNGPGSGEDKYSLSEKESRCVVCKTEEQLTRHHVVPICYRTHLPEEYKSYNMHDVVLLCEGCHTRYEHFATQLKKEFGDIYDAPLEGSKSATSRIVGYCRTILKHEDKLPENIKKEMLDAIKEEFGNNDLQTIQECSKIGSKALITHGELVVSRMNETPQEFVEIWRKHFIETMKPQHLPNGWSVTRSIYYNKERSKNE